jgi:triosephosphate isomerase (TIM)
LKIQPLFFGNWKMNMLCSEAAAFAEQFMGLYRPLPGGGADTGFAPAYTAIAALRDAFRKAPSILIGSQSAHWLDSGAHTGEVSLLMLKEQGVGFVIVGHSERRQFYGENDADVAKRAKAVISHGLTAVVCVGETKDEFEAGKTSLVVDTQLKGSLAGLTLAECPRLVIAYEPVWAIGTGLAATPQIAAQVHNEIRGKLCATFGQDAGAKIPILYGGSTSPKNIAELVVQENIDGALVGGSSLKPDVFWELVKNGRAAKA